MCVFLGMLKLIIWHLWITSWRCSGVQHVGAIRHMLQPNELLKWHAFAGVSTLAFWGRWTASRFTQPLLGRAASAVA